MKNAESMTFATFLNQAWSNHGDAPEKTADELSLGLSLCASPGDIASLVQLTSHLYTEHLHRFDEANAKLESFRSSKFASDPLAQSAIGRCIAALRLASADTITMDMLKPETFGLSIVDFARSLAVATSGTAKTNAVRAIGFFRQSLAMVENMLPSSQEPDLVKLQTLPEGIARTLAIAGNNTAADLEEKLDRTPADLELMILAATTARRFWEAAGTWMEVERAEYRLARSYLSAGNIAEAKKHAELCLTIVERNGGAPLEMFFAYELKARIVRAERASGVSGAESDFNRSVRSVETWFEKLNLDDQVWAKKSLDALRPLH